MNVFISADIEGIGGVVGKLHWSDQGARYRQACEWMTAEVNAAVEGALEAGAKRVLVKDSHNDGTNILLDQLNPAAELLTGWGPLNSMVEGVDASFQAVFLIGYHARGQTLGATLAHSWSFNLLELTLNGTPIGEAAWAAAFAGHFGVPLGLVTGDDKLIAQLKEELPQGYQTVTSKIGWGWNAAVMRSPASVQCDIRKAVAAALSQARQLPVFRPKLPVEMTMRFRHWEHLHACEAVPGVERLSVDKFRFLAADIIEAQKYFSTMNRLARPPQ